MRKRIMCALLSAAVAAAMLSLTACSSKSDSSDISSASETAAEDSTEETSEEANEADSEKPDGEAGGNGEQPPEMPEGGDGETPPEKPDGDGDMAEGGEAPEKPDGEGGMNDGGTPPDKPDGEGGEGGGPGGGQPGGQSSGVESYTAVTEYSEDTEVSGEAYESTGSDENAVLISGGTVSISDSTVTRTSEDSTGGDSSSFYGVGAAILAADGTAYLDGLTVDTDSKGGAGIFSYADAIVYVANSTISTNKSTSGGIHAAGGGTLYAWDTTAETNGESSAAIRSDRGGGTMVVDGGTYTSNGTGSPAVYCTADITVSGAELTATNSEAVCIEGLNTLRLYDCDLTGNMPTNEQNDIDWNIIVYQSMSGDSEVGNGTFQMTGGSLTAQNGGMFYTTNTECTFYLSQVEFNYSEDNPFFLQCTGNSNARGWGNSGSNGSDCTFTADTLSMIGDVVYDSISNLTFYMENDSMLTGAFRDDETWAGEGGDGAASLYIDSSSVWYVTADSTLTNLYNEGTITDEDGNTVTIVGTDGTVYVEGTSSYTVTVQSYSDSADFSGAYTAADYSEYAVENPFAD